MILVNEPTASAREVPFDLEDTNGAAITGHVFANGELKLRLPGGARGNANVANVVEIGGGSYVYVLGQADTLVPGSGILQVDPSLAAAVPLHFDFQIVDPTRFAPSFLAAVIEGEHQVDGGGAVGSPDTTLIQALRLIVGYCAGNGENMDTANGVAIVHSLDGLKNRIVANLANGNRAITSRDKT